MSIIQSARRIEHYHYAIRHLAGAADALTKAGREVIYLNIGDPQVYGFRPPEHIIAPVVNALRNCFTGYTHSAGLLEAREAVAAYASDLGAPATPEEVLITSGASEAADLVLTALLNEDDEVLVPAPGYPIYPAILSKLGATARYYQLDPANSWQPSIDEISSLVGNRTRAIVLINPNNPTGSITSDEVTTQMLELAARHHLLVIADEVYRELCFEKAPTSASVLAEAMGVPLVTLESLSKTFLVPGWRTGWLRFTHAGEMRDLVQAVYRLAGGRLCAPTPAQYAVRPALEGDRTFQLDFINELRQRRDLAVAHVQKIKGLSCDVPQAAFYLMIKAEQAAGHSDERFLLDLLQATGILAVHGSGFGADPRQGLFRMVYLADAATLEIVFNRIAEFLAAD
jgi:alanine-synthesizing transaminase